MKPKVLFRNPCFLKPLVKKVKNLTYYYRVTLLAESRAGTPELDRSRASTPEIEEVFENAKTEEERRRIRNFEKKFENRAR